MIGIYNIAIMKGCRCVLALIATTAGVVQAVRPAVTAGVVQAFRPAVNNTLTAVPGIKVGHYTLAERPTGCTAWPRCRCARLKTEWPS